MGKPRGKAKDPLIHAKGSATLLLHHGRKAHVHAPTRDEDLLPWGDSRSTTKSMSALERNSQVPAPRPQKVLSQRDTAASAREESTRAGPHSRRGLTPLGRLQKYPKINVSTGEESSGSGTDSKQDLRTRHRRERNPERPPSNSHGDWPFLRPPE